MVFAVALGIIVFAGVIYLALSKRSSFKIRLAALVALALMVLAVIVSIFLIFGVVVVEPGATVLTDIPPPETPPPTGTNNELLLMFIVFLIAMFILVLVLSLREQRHREKMIGGYKKITQNPPVNGGEA